MLPQYQRLDASKPRFSISFGRLALAELSLPLGSFLFCVLWSVINDFERATFTHCEVTNYLPSISAAIGSFEPQRSVWQLAIVLHFPLRLACVRLYYHYLRDSIRRTRRAFVNLACGLHLVENLALLCLSLWTSSENYPVHRNAFITFIACSELYMLITYLLFLKARRLPLLPMEEKSLRHKRHLFLINVAAFCLAGYCFLRHNEKCEPMVYTYFALFEYIVVLSNMGYHMTAYWDFYTYSVHLDWQRGLYITNS